MAVAMSGGCGQGRAVFPAADAPVVENWLYTSIGDFDERVKRLSDRPDIAGVQILVPWKMVEPTKGEYDFSQVDRVLSYLNTRGKKMFLQIQDRFFTLPARLPRYLLVEPEYAGGAAPAGGNNGLGEQPPGAIAAQWNPNVRERFHRLMAALAKRFDGKIEGFNLPETSTQIDIKNDKTGYTCGANFEATLDNMRYGLQVFKKSKFVQYVNFWECEWNNDHKYMERTFNLAREKGIGVGGPDVLPNKPAQMANAYPFFNKYKNQVPLVAMAVQEPDFQYINEVTGKPYARKEFVDFARDYLGARILFWATSAPWLGS
ncbi:beta-galactosidase [Mycobacteroides chelonae]|uniref:beta-galactosidase n=1 Tax=Mycobacteroides chelonae TaxID=1774 RepID=UPI001E524DEC|nr:beta-galactosidase [Mycobacteroides chelonae]